MVDVMNELLSIIDIYSGGGIKMIKGRNFSYVLNKNAGHNITVQHDICPA
jgi:hypothetical protein